MKKKQTGRAAQLAVLILLQLAVASLAPAVTRHMNGYWRVLAVKLIYAVSFLLPYALWRYTLRPIADTKEKHIYCEYKIPAFFVAFATIVAALQLNVVVLEWTGYHGGEGTGPFPGFFGVIFSFVMYVFVPAVSEELFTRCALQKLAGGGIRAALFCGVIFGICHFNLSQLIYTVGAGVVLSLLLLYTEDIRLCVALHMTVNTVVLVLSYLSRHLSAGWYVGLETCVWLSVLFGGIYSSRVLLLRYQGHISRRREQISRNRADVTRQELLSAPMLACYGLILAAILLRCL